MKTIKILLLFVIVLFLGCSKDEVKEDCECVKVYYEIEWVVNNTGTGMTQVDVQIETYNVGCEEEINKGDYNGTSYYNVMCK